MKVITKIESTAKPSAIKKRRVAAYCRVSTSAEEQLISLETQKSHYEKFINANPEWEYAGLYYDEGITGTKKEKRPALMKLMRDCERGKIDYILTKSLSRFARNTTDCLELVRKLLDLGIPIFFEKENLDTGTMESELLLSIMSSLAESESVSIAENNNWSTRHRFENGTFKIGYAPYGYSVKNGVFSIIEHEAKWVRYIYAQTLEGKSSAAIAKDLNDRGVPSRRNGKWTPTTVRGILTNEKYLGDCLFQKTYTDSGFKRHTNYGEKDQFYLKDHHEPIVTREDFDAVAALIQQRAKEKNIVKGDAKYQNRYAFTSRLICGECGSTFKRRINSTGTKKYPAWVCREHIEHIENCSMLYVRENAIERAFVTMMNKLIYGRKQILVPLLEKLQAMNNNSGIDRINEIEHLLEENVRQRETARGLFTRGILEPAVFVQNNNTLLLEEKNLFEEKAYLERSLNEEFTHSGEVNKLLNWTASAEMLTAFDGSVFEFFVDKATINSRTEIVFRLKCGLSLKERMD